MTQSQAKTVITKHYGRHSGLKGLRKAVRPQFIKTKQKPKKPKKPPRSLARRKPKETTDE